MKKIAFVALSSLISASRLLAVELTWEGGAGEWNETDLKWTSGGDPAATWSNTANSADIAVFSSGSGTVTVLDEISLGGLRFTVKDYTLSGGSLDFGTQQGIIDTSALNSANSSNELITIASNFLGSGGLTIAAHGNLTANGGASGSRVIISGTNTGLTGTINITSGLVAFTTAAAAGGTATTAGAGNQLVLSNGGGLLHTSSSATAADLGNNIEISTGGGTIRVYGSQTLTLNGKLTGSATLTKTDSGTLTLTNNSSGTGSFTGDINVAGGTLRFNRAQNSGNVLTTGIVTVASGATLSITPTHSGAYTSGRTYSLGQQVIFNGGTLVFGGSGGAQYSRLIDSTSLVVNNASTMTLTSGGYGQYVRIEGAVSGAGNLTLKRSGAARSLQFVGNMSNYSGNVTVEGDNSANAVTFGHVSGWGTGALTNSNTGSIVRLGDELASVYNGNFTGGTLGFTSGTMAATGLVTLNAGTILEVNNRAAGYNVQFEARGGMVINGATLRANGTAGTSAFVPYANTTWSFGGTAASTVSANINMAHANATFDVTDATGSTGSDVVVSGNISGSHALNKSGVGTLELSGDNSAFSGGFNVNGGTLKLASTSALGTGAVILNNGHLDASGITLSMGSKLGGNGSVSGVIEFVAGGELSPGNSIGSLTFSDDVVLHAGAKLIIEVNSDTNSSDTLVFSGTGNPGLSFESGAILQVIDLGGGSLAGKQYQFVTGGDITGAGLVSYSDANYSYTLNDSGLLSITAIPEPSTYVLFAGVGMIGLIAFRRRRK